MSDLISRQAVLDAINGTFWSGIEKAINAIPSAETPTVVEKHQLSAETPTNTPTDLISRQGAIAYFFRPYSNEELYSNIDIEKALNALPSASDSRQRGEWVLKENVFGVAYCSNCDYELHTNNTPFCPNCGAYMRKEESEEDYDYERAIDQLEHDIAYEPTYNPEDGSM